MSSAESLSMPSVDGLIASVGSDCHFERTAIPAILQFHVSHAVDGYLTHLQVERRLAVNSVESYARDLVLLQQFAAGKETRVDKLTRQQLEELVRQLMSEGRSPRSVARAIACYRGF